MPGHRLVETEEIRLLWTRVRRTPRGQHVCAGTIYIAARYGRIHDARRVAKVLSQHGVSINASWLKGPDSEPSLTGPELQQWALTDLHDIARSNLFVFLSEPPDNPFGRGGRHVELGYALALGKTCIGIGPKENIFRHLGQLIFVQNAQEEAKMVLSFQRKPSGLFYPELKAI